MPVRIPFRGLPGLSLCLALLQGCAAALGSKTTDVAAVPRPSGVEVVLDRSATDPNPNANASVRSGFHVGLGLGAGRADVTCDGCVFNDKTGFSGFLSVARSVGQKTLLGVEATGWRKETSGNSIRVYSLMAHLTEYLNRSSGLFLRTGLGLIGVSQDFRDISANGLGFSGRLGYELGTGAVVVVPYVGYLRGLGGAGAKADGADSGIDVIISNFQFGLSIAAP
jgi:hypothetical protein